MVKVVAVVVVGIVVVVASEIGTAEATAEVEIAASGAPTAWCNVVMSPILTGSAEAAAKRERSAMENIVTGVHCLKKYNF